MAKIIALHGGTADGVYDDRWRSIYEALGVLSVRRASEVEFDAGSGEWVAVHCATGQIIGRGRNRSDVIAQEVEWLEKNVIEEAKEVENDMDNQGETQCHTR